ncbi:MAG: SAM-dependent methyltransferase [Thiobacillaceae bacterium]|nr:SAM-dependent methyltransferase [Thiobacillaceae bacterium]
MADCRARPPLAAIFLLSAATLAYEVLLTRLFSLIQWHHYAHMIISLALLGFGLSGALLAAWGERLARRLETALAWAAAGFGIGAVLAFLAARAIAFNPLELAWGPEQAFRLLATYGVLALPFLCAGGGIGLALMALEGQRHRLYAADLLGAGSGALAVVVGLQWLPPGRALLLVGALGLLAAARFAPGSRARLPLYALAVIVALLPAPSVAPSAYKPLTRTLAAEGARVLAEVDGAQGRATALVNPQAPLRDAPGLSPLSPYHAAPQIALFVDGEPVGGVPLGDRRYLGELPSAAPYALLEAPRVLSFGLGATTWQALDVEGARVRVVADNASLIRLLGRLRENPPAGGLPPIPEVVLGDPRAYLAAERARHDLIVLHVPVTPGGLAALRENTLLTVPGLRALLARLQAGGWLAISTTAGLPPRELLKLAATARAALGDEAARRVAVVRGYRAATLLIKAAPIEARELAALAAFAAPRGFDLDYPAGLPEGGNPRADIAEGLAALLAGDAQAFLAGYRMDLNPASDDRPYFFHFFRAEAAGELYERRAAGGLALLDWGYLTAWATLAQAALLALLLLLPSRKRGGGAPVFAYFSALGLGFMLLEIAFMQQLVLLLGHPVYAVALVLTAFLVGAGLGARQAPRFAARLGWVVAAIALFALLNLLLLAWLAEVLAPWPLAARMAVAALAVAPLAFCLGMPFPLGLAALGQNRAAAAWAWGVNGAASVIAAISAQLAAAHFGFTAVVLAALLLYGAAWLGFGKLAGVAGRGAQA